MDKAKNAQTPADNGITGAAVEYSRKIWLAGIGAMLRGGQEGRGLFESLIKEGEQLESRGRANWSETRQDISQRWDSIENAFNDTVSKTVGSLGVATGDDLKQLDRNIKELGKQVKALKRS